MKNGHMRSEESGEYGAVTVPPTNFSRPYFSLLFKGFCSSKVVFIQAQCCYCNGCFTHILVNVAPTQFLLVLCNHVFKFVMPITCGAKFSSQTKFRGYLDS